VEHGRSDLHRIFTDVLKNAAPDQGPILAWPIVCGPGVANRTQPIDFMSGVLRVRVPDREWQAQLEALAGDYLKAFAMLQEVKRKVERIEFIVGK